MLSRCGYTASRPYRLNTQEEAACCGRLMHVFMLKSKEKQLETSQWSFLLWVEVSRDEMIWSDTSLTQGVWHAQDDADYFRVNNVRKLSVLETSLTLASPHWKHSVTWQLSVSVICFCSLLSSLFWHRVGFFFNLKQSSTNTEEAALFYRESMKLRTAFFFLVFCTRQEGFLGVFSSDFSFFLFTHHNYLELEKWQRKWGSRGEI